MTIREILENQAHRPWELRTDSWKYYQEWNNVLFFHFQVNHAKLRSYVPAELEIDLFEDKAWISVVIFTMENSRPKHLPAISSISNFDEINIRTYVKANNKTGVYFLSIEGGKRMSCAVAKAISGLPYRHSKIKRSNGVLQSENQQFQDKLDVEFRIGKEIMDKTDLDTWLTERYALFQETDNAINEFEIHHSAWPLNEIDFKMNALNYERYEKILNNHPSKSHYSKGVQVLAWGKKSIQKI